MSQEILIAAHGSRHVKAMEEARAFIGELSSHMNRMLHACFLELADPDLAEGLSAAAARAGAGGEVIVQPLFLGKAGHQKNDLAAAIAWARGEFPQVSFRQGVPLDPHALLVRLAQERVAETLKTAGWEAGDTGVLIIGRGSSDPDSNSELSRSARIFFEGGATPEGASSRGGGAFPLVEIGFQAVARPDPIEALARCQRLGASQIVVLPYLLFSGRVEDDIHEKCIQTAQILGVDVKFTNHLYPHPLLLEVTAQRIKDAMDGEARMTCDVCKYRFPISPYEGQVGRAQHTHHLHGGSHGHHDHHDHHGHSHPHD